MRALSPPTLLAAGLALTLCHCRFDLARLRGPDTDAALDNALDEPSDDAPAFDAPDNALDEPSDEALAPDASVPDAPPDTAVDAPADASPEAAPTPCALTLASTATALDAGGALLLYDTVAGAPNQAMPSCVDTSIYTSAGDRIYRYRVADGTTLTASTQSGTDFAQCPSTLDTVLTLATHCDATTPAAGRLSCVDDSRSQFGCDSGGTSVSSLSTVTVTPGQDVFVTVDSLISIGSGGPSQPTFRLSLTENAVPLIPPPVGTNPYCLCPPASAVLRAAASVNFPVMSLTATERTFDTVGRTLTSASTTAPPFPNHAGGVFEFRLTANTLVGDCRALFDLSYANLRVTSFAVPSTSAGGPLSTVLRTPPMTRGAMATPGAGGTFTLTLRGYDSPTSTTCTGSVRFDWGRVTLLGY